MQITSSPSVQVCHYPDNSIPACTISNVCAFTVSHKKSFRRHLVIMHSIFSVHQGTPFAAMETAGETALRMITMTTDVVTNSPCLLPHLHVPQTSRCVVTVVHSNVSIPRMIWYLVSYLFVIACSI